LKISTLKSNFIQAISKEYPSEEIQSFFSILSEKYLGLSRLQIAMNLNTDVSETISEKFENATLRLKKHEPIQYIIGETEFYGLPFLVDEHTLIPRPETEELVDWILSDAKTQDPTPKTLLDIGTGSGCIAITLAKNCPEFKVSALDISQAALQVAQKNSVAIGSKVQFLQLDILATKMLPQNFDIIVSNPPYVRMLEKELMQPNVLKYEPDSALFVNDENPLVFYHKIANLAENQLNNGGFLYFEINEYLTKDLVSLLKKMNFKNIEVRKDIFGKDRMIKCKKNE